MTPSRARGSNESWRFGLLGSIRSESNRPQSSKRRWEPTSKRWALPVICRVAPWNVIRNQHPPDDHAIALPEPGPDGMRARRFSILVPEPTLFSERPRAVGRGSVSLDSSEVTSLYHARNPPPHQADPAIYRQAQQFTGRTPVQLYLTEVYFV